MTRSGCVVGFLVAAVLPLILFALVPNTLTDDSTKAMLRLSTRSFACTTGGQNKGATLRLYMPIGKRLTMLARMLCQDPEVKQSFERVEAVWALPSHEVSRGLVEGQISLAFLRPERVAGLNLELVGFAPVASYPTYEAYLIGRSEKPELSPTYLLSRRIGLIQNHNSRSGFILPMKKFRELGLEPDSMRIIYAVSHAQLRQLLRSKEVDVIASYWSDKDAKEFDPKKKTRLADGISGAKWYLRAPVRSTGLRCAVATTLKRWAQGNQDSYYRKLSITNDCRNEGA
jgi:ABC-type phosphate/phosphonate transport system substrate-binding protein